MAEAGNITTREHIEARVLSEQVALMCRLTTSPCSPASSLGAMMAWLRAEDHGANAAVTWYVTLLLVLLLRWRVAAAYLRQPRDTADTKRWRNIMMLLAALGGGVWSIAGSFLLPHRPHQRNHHLGDVHRRDGLGHGFAGAGAPCVCMFADSVRAALYRRQLLLGGDRIIVGARLHAVHPGHAGDRRSTDRLHRAADPARDRERIVGRTVAAGTRSRQPGVAGAGNAARTAATLDPAHSRSQHRARTPGAGIARARMATWKDSLIRSRTTCERRCEPSTASHACSAMRKAKASAPRHRHYLQRIRTNVAHMAALIDDLLEFARCGRQSLELGGSTWKCWRAWPQMKRGLRT